MRRFGLVAAGAALAAAGASAASAASSPDPIVRVLLIETEGSVQVDHGAGTVRVQPGRGALQVDGESVGRIFRPRRRRGSDAYSVDGTRVRGELEFRRTDSGLRVINHVALEDYVAGTLGREVYSSWHLETLKAQAVVTRTYALHEMARFADRAFDVGSGTGSQVYGGVDAETGAVWRAVRATRGEYLAFDGRPILAVFHSASGGRTAAAEEVWGESIPYLTSIEVPDEEDSPDTYWRTTVSRTTLERSLAPFGLTVGSIREMGVSRRSESGRAAEIRIRGTRETQKMPARTLRTALGDSVIRSTLFEIRAADDGFTFVGSGHGHGVGMSQWGAQAMALAGEDHEEILETFYPGAELREVSD